MGGDRQQLGVALPLQVVPLPVPAVLGALVEQLLGAMGRVVVQFPFGENDPVLVEERPLAGQGRLGNPTLLFRDPTSLPRSHAAVSPRHTLSGAATGTPAPQPVRPESPPPGRSHPSGPLPPGAAAPTSAPAPTRPTAAPGSAHPVANGPGRRPVPQPSRTASSGPSPGTSDRPSPGPGPPGG